jgi:hypothetical protein
MPQVLKTVSIDLGSNRTGTLLLPQDVVDYFGITVVTTAATFRTRTRKAYTRQVYSELSATATGKSVAVQAATWTDTPSPPKRGAGQAIIVPTELKTTKGNIRMVTMRFPSKAVIGAISEFLFTKCTKNKPGYFLTENGVRHLVVNVTGNVNPTPAAAPNPTPTA